MDSDTLLYLGIGVAGVLPGAAVALLLLRRRCSKEWGELVEKFPAGAEPPGKVFTRHTVRVGPDVCTQCVTVVVADPGLYMRADGYLRRRPAVLIPWNAFRDV